MKNLNALSSIHDMELYNRNQTNFGDIDPDQFL